MARNRNATMSGQVISPVLGPGQHVIKREDAESEGKLPWRQTLRGMLCNMIVYAAVTACALIIGKWTLLIIAALAVALAVVVAWQWTQSAVGVGVVIVVSLSILLIAGPPLAQIMWPTVWTAEHWLVKCWMVAGLLFILVIPFSNGSYRYHGEVADPSGPTPPRAAIPWTGLIWPWQAKKVFEELNYEEAPAPKQVTHTTTVEITEPQQGNGRYSYARFNVDPARMQRVAQALTAGHPFSEREMVREGLLTGRLEYEAVRAELIEMGLARWRVKGIVRQGVQVTSKGAAVMRGLAEAKVSA